jgi:hypothetical protein
MFKGQVLLSAVAALALGAGAMTPGGIEKKFVGLCFDTMFNAPTNILAHADAINAITWLDGIAISLRDVTLRAADGSVVTTDTCRVMQLGHRWTREAIVGELPTFREIVKHPSMRESFLLAWITPRGKEDRIAWGDDAEWKVFADNMATLAWFAKEAGLKGLMLDPEEYAGALQYLYLPGDAKSFAECAALARQRGREVFSRVFEEFPDAVLFFLWTMEHHVRYFAARGVTAPRQLSDDSGELLPYFYNGMLDVIPPSARFVDGAEHYSLTSTKDMYWKGALNQLVGARPFVAPENWGKYRAQLLVGNTHYLDMFRTNANPKSHWYHGPVDGSRLEHLRRNVVQSLEVADEYVWIYGEGGRLIDWRGGPGRHQRPEIPLWEALIPGLSETLLMAKDPEKLMAMRKEERRRKGELKNLAEGQCNLPASFAMEDKARPMSIKSPPSVKNVRPGELYSVRQRFRFSIREGAPSLKVTWKKAGRPVAEKNPVPLVTEPGQPGGWQWARALVTVPKDADELVVDISADLFPEDSVSGAETEIIKLDEAPDAAELARKAALARKDAPRPASGKRAKWSFDEAAKTLTDGNWTLKASYSRDDTDKTSLAVSGKGAQGSGILDFTGVEADTGKRVTFIGDLTKNDGVTALIGPDITAIGMDGLKACPALRSVEISTNVVQLAMSCCAGCTNLVLFAPTTFKESAKLGGNAFAGCELLSGDFSYEGTNAIPGAFLSGTSISSFLAPRCAALHQRAFSNCPRLKCVVFAQDVSFKDADERADFMRAERGRAGLLANLVPKNSRAGEMKAPRSLSASLSPAPSVKGVVPGELYGVGISMKATAWEGSPHFSVKWRGEGRPLAWETERPFTVKGAREHGVWRRGEMLVRVPPGADELVFNARANVLPGESFDFDKVEIFKLGEPLPKWPEEAERPKQ